MGCILHKFVNLMMHSIVSNMGSPQSENVVPTRSSYVSSIDHCFSSIKFKRLLIENESLAFIETLHKQ